MTNVMQSATLRTLGSPIGAGVISMDFDPIAGLLKGGLGRAVHPVHQVTIPLAVGTPDSFVWTCMEGIWRVDGAVESHNVVGGAGASVQVVVCPGSVAIASGTAQLTAALDLTVTAPAKQFG